MRAELKEYQAVEEAAMKFVKSVAEGNSKYAKELFTDDAVLFGYLDGKLEHGSIEQFYHNVDTVSGGDNFKARVDVLLVEESLAVVRVLEEVDTHDHDQGTDGHKKEIRGTLVKGGRFRIGHGSLLKDAYFPTQKVEKTRSRSFSSTLSPVISDSALWARSRSRVQRSTSAL